MKVAVLKGGRSLERGVSLRSGARVEDALERLGHEVLALEADGDLVKRLAAQRPDIAFVAMHGPGGEDGTAQELLEILGIPFTGPGVAACARCIDKVLAKHELRAAGIPTPDWFAFNETAFRELGAGDALSGLEERLGFPLVVKPSRGGSALGIKFAENWFDVPEALVSAFSYDDRVLLERFVDGRELAVSVLGNEPLPVVEAIPRAGDSYDFEARYEIGRTSFVCPAELTAAEGAAVTEAALGAYKALGCSGFSRVDLILGDAGPQVLEVNAIPGLTDTSLLPQAAEAAGMSFEGLVEKILELALDGEQSSRSGDAGRLTRGAHTGA
ncbi:MAG TPA: D-alanine--D-alanine ligase [Solirubrobacterales bacterium]|nr:D-alanine--D-alanine ligase [Solirubrobacterales bacterium]